MPFLKSKVLTVLCVLFLTPCYATASGLSVSSRGELVLSNISYLPCSINNLGQVINLSDSFIRITNSSYYEDVEVSAKWKCLALDSNLQNSGFLWTAIEQQGKTQIVVNNSAVVKTNILSWKRDMERYQANVARHKSAEYNVQEIIDVANLGQWDFEQWAMQEYPSAGDNSYYASDENAEGGIIGCVYPIASILTPECKKAKDKYLATQARYSELAEPILRSGVISFL
jgi:hypothetical protein